MSESDVIARAFDAGAAIRTVNFHLTPSRRTIEYDQQFALYAEHFASVTAEDLDHVTGAGQWKKPKPGLILAFYNGYRNNFNVARPLLEKHGLVGWFFVVTGFVNAADQRAFAIERNITCGDGESADGRLALSWDEIAALDGPHVVASHTRSHSRASIDPTRLPDEVGGSQEDFVRQLGHPVRAIAWNGGATYGEYQAADQAIDAAGFQFVLSNLKVQRLRDWP